MAHLAMMKGAVLRRLEEQLWGSCSVIKVLPWDVVKPGKTSISGCGTVDSCRASLPKDMTERSLLTMERQDISGRAQGRAQLLDSLFNKVC